MVVLISSCFRNDLTHLLFCLLGIHVSEDGYFYILFPCLTTKKTSMGNNYIHYEEFIYINKQRFGNTEVGIKKENSEKLANVGYTRRRNRKHNHNTICLGHHALYANKQNNVNKICILLQTTTGTSFLCGNRNETSHHGTYRHNIGQHTHTG